MSGRLSPSRSLSFSWKKRMPNGLPSMGRSDFRSGREAMYALLSRYLKTTGKGKVLLPVWVPEGIYQPCFLAGWEIHFYPLDREGHPDWKTITNLLATRAFDLVVLIHYFGLARDTIRLAQMLPASTTLLEDWAHTYPDEQWPPPLPGNWALFSPTKLIGVTDGAWLIGPAGQALFALDNRWLDTYGAWQLLYLFANTFLRYRVPGDSAWRRLAGGAYQRGYRLLVRGIEHPRSMSRLGKWLLRHALHEKITTHRRTQARRYHKGLVGPGVRSLLTPGFEDHPLIGFPLWVENAEDFDRYLRTHGIRGQRFTERWWFLPEEREVEFAAGRALMEHHYLLPLHHSFTEADIDYIISVVNGY